ncbi:MAG TPA: glycosyltransferase family 2 protein [Myxococcales bacterium]|nr:glycosyltransferase family 2 protein [Myxococcales bacterium]
MRRLIARLSGRGTDITYGKWVARYDTPSRRRLNERLARLKRRPLFSILMLTPGRGALSQIYPGFELCAADDWAAALERARGDFVILLDGQGELSPHALLRLAEEAEAHPEAALLYSDEDRLDEHGRRFEPSFKPDFSLDLLQSLDFIGGVAAWRRSLVLESGGLPGAEHDLALRVCGQLKPAQIRHVPEVLYHRRGPARATSARRMRQPLPEPAPLVSLIIPTRDRAELLRACIESIRRLTKYPRYELIVVDNGSSEATALSYLAELEAGGATVLRHPGPFNFSGLNNLAARAAKGEVLGFLNNDLEAIDGGWLEEMVSQAMRPEVGAVGAKLLFPNGTVQHAGIILGLGDDRVAGTPHRGIPRDSPGYGGRAAAVQELSAVSAACLVMRKQVFEEVGGFDAVNLAVAYNDVDLCLRLRERGYRVLWTPYAELYHKESASRGSDRTPENRDRFALEVGYMRKRWGALLEMDPYFNPNLSLDSDAFLLAAPPRRAR